jgi:DNA (cytosine-5)-methyltransferase 1
MVNWAGRKRAIRLKAVDLFAGAGGLSLGLKQARFDVVAAIEIDPVAAETYRANHPGTEIWNADIRSVAPEDVLRGANLASGELDLLAGCPPCQGFSTLRTRKKSRVAHDPRNDLVSDFVRFARAMMPRAIMLENVPGLALDSRFENVKERLQSLGYALQWRVVDAADYGVPQRRKRLILVGALGSEGPGVARSAGVARCTVRDAIGHLERPGRSGDLLHDLPTRRSPRIQQLIANVPKNGGSRMQLRGTTQLACHTRCDGFFDVYGRMAWDDVAPTITTGCHNPSKGRFIHPTQNRAITLREAALLQSFPATYSFSLARGKEHAAMMIGNALPPVLIAQLADPIRRHLKGMRSGKV